MISNIFCFSLLFALAASECNWDATICDAVKSVNIDDEVKKYTDRLGTGHTFDANGDLETVLAIDLKCLKNACNGANVANDVEQCRLNAKMTVENQLQFVPSNFRQQMKKVCDCGYGDKTNEKAADGVTSYNDPKLKSLYNCDVDKSNGKYCHNAPRIVLNYGVCGATDDTQKEQAMVKTREAMEVIRIRTFCKGEVKSMVNSDGLLTGSCAEEEALREALIKRCDDQCYHKMENLAVTSDTEDPGFYMYDYYWDNNCDNGEKNVRDTSGKSAAVKMTEVCWEYLATKEIPVQLRYPMYTEGIFKDSELKAALDAACNLDLSKYTNVKYEDLSDTLGKVELEQMGKKQLATEYGFTANMRRALLTKESGNCWDKKNPTYSHCSKDGFPETCDDGIEKMDICTSATVDNSHWFIKYLPGDATDAALQACKEGAYFGKHILALPGMSTTFAAEKLGKAADKYKMAIFLAFHDCAVAMSMKANNYFASGPDNCNANAMSVKALT